MSMAISGPEASPLRSRPSQQHLEVLGTTAEATGASGKPAAPERLPHEWRGLSLGRFNGTVFGILALTLFIYVTVVFCVILPWLSWSVPGVLNLALLTLSTGTALACFLACVMVDPGRVAPDYQPDLEAHAVMQVKRKSGEARFCQKCARHKPPRAHHCRVCRRCVLRMDHHCPWINNCVGHGNYKAFLLFLIYVNAAVVHALGLLCGHALHALALLGEHRPHALRMGVARGALMGGSSALLVSGGGNASVAARAGGGGGGHGIVLWAVAQTVCMALTLPLTVGLLMLLGWNLYLALINRTTIEYHEGVTANVQAARGGASYSHPYDLGVCGNLHALCGGNAPAWLLPTRAAAAGDGISFPTTWDSGLGI